RFAREPACRLLACQPSGWSLEALGNQRPREMIAPWSVVRHPGYRIRLMACSNPTPHQFTLFHFNWLLARFGVLSRFDTKKPGTHKGCHYISYTKLKCSGPLWVPGNQIGAYILFTQPVIFDQPANKIETAAFFKNLTVLD